MVVVSFWTINKSLITFISDSRLSPHTSLISTILFSLLLLLCEEEDSGGCIL